MPSGLPAGCGAPVKKTAAKGHTAKHASAAKKHASTKKHTPAQVAADKKFQAAGAKAAKVHAKAKHATHAKAVALALGDGVACCAAEALAASLRLQGVRVSDEDVLALYWHTASDPDAGASIVATLEAAWRFGLGGIRPVSFESAWPCVIGRRSVLEQALADQAQHLSDRQLLGYAFSDQCSDDARLIEVLAPAPGQLDHVIVGDVSTLHGASLILGLELPGPHAVLATPDGWWSWGELHDPAEWPDAVVEAAWAVAW